MAQMENKDKYILLDNLFNLFLDAKYDTEDENFLKEKNIDIDQVVKKNIMLFRQLKTQAIAELNKAKHDRVKDFVAKLKTGLESNVAEYKKIADEIFATPKFAELQPMFRNLSQVSERDKKSILLDSRLLDMLGEMEEEYKKGEKNE